MVIGYVLALMPFKSIQEAGASCLCALRLRPSPQDLVDAVVRRTGTCCVARLRPDGTLLLLLPPPPQDLVDAVVRGTGYGHWLEGEEGEQRDVGERGGDGQKREGRGCREGRGGSGSWGAR